MFSMKTKRIWNAYWFGWKDVCIIAKDPNVHLSRFALFRDLLHCFREYYLFGYNYRQYQVWKMPKEKRQELADSLGKENKRKDEWIDVCYENWRFLKKWTPYKWQESWKRIQKRKKAYIRHYGLKDINNVQYGVTITTQHFTVGDFYCGNDVLLARNVDIDYTGDLTIEASVVLSEGVKILTHEHDLDFIQRDSLRHGLIKTPLIIHDNVGIGAHAIIMPGVTEIGRGAMISTGAVVRKRVPPYAIVMGNPSRVVGFRYTPDQIIELEEELYPEEKRIPEDELKRNYEFYYLKRIQEIKAFLGQ